MLVELTNDTGTPVEPLYEFAGEEGESNENSAREPELPTCSFCALHAFERRRLAGR